MTTERDRTLQLSDGRVLGYAEYGDPAGLPLLFFHGLPGSRLDLVFPGADDALQARGLRCLALDRPGIGLSRPTGRRRLLDWPVDVRGFADAAGIDRFAVLGWSAGAPYALACARTLGERVVAVGAVAGPAPPGVRELAPVLTPAMRRTRRLARWLHPLLRGPMRDLGAAIARPDVALDRLVPSVSEVDRDVLADHGLRGVWLSSWREAFRQGPDGPWWDLVLVSRPWGFVPSELAMPVQLWLGGADRQVPAAMGRYLASSLQRSEARLYPHEGHFSLLVRRFGEILDGVVTAIGRAASTT